MTVTRERDLRLTRRAVLTRQLAEVTRELLAIERAEALRPTITEPTMAQLGDPLASHSGHVRAWAADNGYTLKPRGRLPKAILEQYAAAHPEQDPTA